MLQSYKSIYSTYIDKFKTYLFSLTNNFIPYSKVLIRMTLNVLSQHYVVLPKVFEVDFYFSFDYIILSGQVILSSSFSVYWGP